MAITGSGSGGSSTLDGLSDVVITAPANSHVLHYDGAQWENLNSASDWLSQYLYLPGRTGGQVLGAGAHTGGNTTDLVIENRVMAGDSLSGINFTNGRVLDIRHAFTNGSTMVNIQPSVTGLANVASGTLTALQILLTGTPGYTSGSFTARGFFFNTILVVPSGVTLTEGLGGQFQTALGGVSGTSTKVTGLRVNSVGSTGGNTLPILISIDCQLANRVSDVTNASALNFSLGAGTAIGSGIITNFRLIDSANTGSTALGDDAEVVNWTGLFIPDVTLPTGTILGLDIAIQGNRLKGLHLGTGATTAHFLSIEAGTTVKAPIKLTAGVNLTAPVAGVIEFDGLDLFITDSTPTRQTIELQVNKGAASGYADLDGTTKVPTAQLGTGVADSSTFLRGDRAWSTPTASPSPPLWGRVFATMGA